MKTKLTWPGLLLLTAACGQIFADDEQMEKAKTAALERHNALLQKDCASQAGYEKLKAIAFEQAVRVRGGDKAWLDKLAAASSTRMERPVVSRRDERLSVTTCAGRLVLDLPPGTIDPIDRARRLSADVEYRVQPAADGSGPVYRMSGAEPIVYRLAMLDMRRHGDRTAADTRPATAATAEPPVSLIKEAAKADPPPPRPIDPQRKQIATSRPSFDCRYARSRTERLICSSDELADRDREMAAVYNETIANSDVETVRAIRRSRDRFLARRERCGSADCVAQVYDDRIDEIEALGEQSY